MGAICRDGNLKLKTHRAMSLNPLPSNSSPSQVVHSKRPANNESASKPTGLCVRERNPGSNSQGRFHQRLAIHPRVS